MLQQIKVRKPIRLLISDFHRIKRENLKFGVRVETCKLYVRLWSTDNNEDFRLDLITGPQMQHAVMQMCSSPALCSV